MNHEQIEAMVTVLKDAPRLAEIEIRTAGGTGAKGATLRLRRPVSPTPATPARPKSRAATNGAAPVAAPAAAKRNAPAAEGTVEATAGLVGVFRNRKGELPAVGDAVAEGQVIGHVESLGLYTECTSPSAGRVVTVLVHDGDPVEFGQPLVEIDTRPETGDGAADSAG